MFKRFCFVPFLNILHFYKPNSLHLSSDMPRPLNIKLFFTDYLFIIIFIILLRYFFTLLDDGKALFILVNRFPHQNSHETVE